MSGVNPENERVKRRYFHYLREAEGRADATVEHATRAIAQYEKFTSWRAFNRFKSDHAIAYRKLLLAGGGKRAAELSSRATVHTKLTQVEKFFRWLAGQPGFKKRISYTDVEYFGLSGRDRKLALERRERPTPSLEQVQHVIRSMPADGDIELRDRAVVACVLLTGIRVSALTGLRLKHVRIDGLGIEQDAREMKTKFGKSFPTFFFPVGEDILDIFKAYVRHLREALLWGPDDPLFPKSQMYVGPAHKFEWVGLDRRHWQTADPVRDIFQRAFTAAGLIYYPPHSIRRTLTRLGQQLCSTPEAMKAWSQNLGHDDVITTLTSYGAVPVQRQAEIIAQASLSVPNQADLAKVLAQLVASLPPATATSFHRENKDAF